MIPAAQQALDALKEKKATFSFQLDRFIATNEKVHSFLTGGMSLAAFLEQLQESDPYDVEEMTEGKYVIKDKAQKVQFFQRFQPDLVKNIWEHMDLLQEVFPETKPEVTAALEDIRTNKCQGCAKNGRAVQILNNLQYLDVRGRDLSKVQPLLGKTLIEQLLKGPSPRPPAPPPAPPSQAQPVHNYPAPQAVPFSPELAAIRSAVLPANLNQGPRPSCINCYRKHIAKAISQLSESLLGYPDHRWLAIGNISEAEDEAVKDYPALAQETRAERILMMAEVKYMPDLMKFFGKAEEASMVPRDVVSK